MTKDVHELLRLAFGAAREKGKQDWWRMTTAVLKNRLLSLTDRQFDERDYGSRTIIDFASSYPDLLTVDSAAFPPEVELRPTRIREDLWRAVMDYASGKEFVWDELQCRARPRTKSDDRVATLPTVDREELTVWREEFAARQKSALSPAETTTLGRWVRDGLQTKALPERLKPLWNHEVSWRVWERLASWFASRLPADQQPSIPMILTSAKARGGNPNAGAASKTSSDALSRCRDSGDWLGAGELLSQGLGRATEDVEGLLAQIIVLWAQPLQYLTVKSFGDLISHLDDLVPEYVGTALINVCHRLRRANVQLPGAVSDLVFRLSDTIATLFDVEDHRSTMQLCVSATGRLMTVHDRLRVAVDAFARTNPSTAKGASIEIVRAAREYRPLSLAAERVYLRELEILLGTNFRRFCESCEQHDAIETARRADELQAQVLPFAAGQDDPRHHSSFWREFVRPIVKHIEDLVEEGTKQSEEFNRPQLALVKGPQKLDLTTVNRPTVIPCRLQNNGHGRASRIDVVINNDDLAVECELVEPNRPFDVPGNASQVVSFSISIREPVSALRISLTWICSGASQRSVEFADVLEIEQQSKQPDWDDLLVRPPYTINPVKTRDGLFGRDAILQRLFLHAASGTSTFLWGQKRVGKTSVLQVLESELASTGEFACVFLRMGELVALHEGQIAHTIAIRLNVASGVVVSVPSEDHFGAGLNRLVPIIGELAGKTKRKLVVIVDEFDDLDPAFYTGERGRQFVKALRSLSEVGLTFFFVGSERMDAIYRRHDVELNKWINVSLDRIEAIADCRALITRPVTGAIEYEDAAIDFVVQYCGGNPFYMHLFCFEVFKRCVEEHRTYVSDVDVQVVRQHLLRTLGRTNFAHFWEDNPELGTGDQTIQVAENCLVLALVASLGGRYEDVEEVFDAQDALNLAVAESMTKADAIRSLERLRRRRVLALNPRSNYVEISLPIFRDWLAEHADDLVPTWRAYVHRPEQVRGESSVVVAGESGVVHFPIAEDELLAVSQRLVYCGKQKDVAEVRRWLRQFDDDSRIEVAFLLLKRLAEQGYMSEGAKARAFTLLEEALQDRRVRLGSKTWKIARGRKDNLCVTYVDSETKSGASTAREFSKRVRPGKVGGGNGIDSWLAAHRENDPLVVIVDDFAGTGRTLESGLKQLVKSVGEKIWDEYVQEGRVLCYVQFAFPEALDRLKASFPRVEFHAAHIFADDVRALEPGGLFEVDEDRVYARDILLQIGRQLTHQNPLGWGDMGVLVAFHNTIPNNSLPIFWSSGQVNDRQWFPLFPRA